jgi:hypothetical protein
MLAAPPRRRHKNRHYSLATYVLLRGITLLVRVGNKPTSPPLLRQLLAPTRLQHGDTLLMCAACSQVSPPRPAGVRSPNTQPRCNPRGLAAAPKPDACAAHWPACGSRAPELAWCPAAAGCSGPPTHQRPPHPSACASPGQVVYAFLMMPQTLPASYVRFFRRQGAKELYVWQAVRVRGFHGDSGRGGGSPSVPHPPGCCWSHHQATALLCPTAAVRLT